MEPSNNEILKAIKYLDERVSLLERVAGEKNGQLGQSAPPARLPELSPEAPVLHDYKPAPAVQKSSAEMEIGQKWVSVVGVLLIFLATLFFVQYVFKFLGPVGKVLLSYAGAALLFGIGAFARKKYSQFAAVVTAGAWGVTYLVTYAMHFFPATRIIVSAPVAMFLLTLVVVALLVTALYQKSKHLVALSLVLGVLTMVLSPLSLFSIVGTVLLLAVFVAIAVAMPWGDLVLPASIGAYFSYFMWFTGALGFLPAQGGGLLGKEMTALIALVLLWALTAIGIFLRKDEEKSFGGQVDALTLILSFAGTAVLGLMAMENLTLVVTTPRIARAIWLLLLGGLCGGWAILTMEFKLKKDAAVAGGIMAMITLMAGIAYALPEKSSGTALAWAAMGLIIVVAGMGLRNPRLAAISILPFVASTVRFLASDLQKNVSSLTTGLSLNIVLGLVLTAVLAGSAAMLRTLDITSEEDKGLKRLPGLLLAMGLLVFGGLANYEFNGAVPSVLWGLAGIVTVATGFLAHWKDARLAGLLLLALTVVRVFIHDLSDLEALPRVISFAILGGLLLAVAYGYNHNREKLQHYLEEE